MNCHVRTGAVLALALVVAACSSAQSGHVPPPQRVNVGSLPAGASAAAEGESELTSAVLAAVNAYRSEQGLGALAPDAGLQKAAAVHSADMSLRGFIGDFNPDGQGVKERVAAAKPGFAGSVGENIAVLAGVGAKAPSEVARDVLKAWTSNPARRKFMRDASYTATGVGVAAKGDTLYVTEVFAGP